VSPTALALVVAAALTHSLWNLWLKSGRWSLGHWLWAVVVGVTLLSPTLAVFRVAEIPPQAWAMIAVSGLFQAAYCVMLTAAYEAGELSLVYPIVRGTAPVVVTLLGVLLLGERPPPTALAGIALVVAGLFATHLGGARDWPARLGLRASALAALTGLAIVGYSLVDKRAVGLVPPPLYLCLVHVVCAAALVAVLLVRRDGLRPAAGRRDRLAVVGVGVASFGAYLLVLFAMRLAPVSYVVAAREVSVVFAAVLGVTVLGEQLRPVRMAGALAVFLGLVALALSP
jgi:drug/metabolite transporter (DMT)-like permease